MAQPMPVPPNMGGDRVFIADANDTNISSAVGDTSAAFLQFVHLMAPQIDAGADGVARRLTVNRIVDDLKRVMTASDVSKTRERSVRELKPVTTLPAVEYGVAVNTANIRMINIPAFTGTNVDTIDVVRWIGRVLNLAQSNGLTFDATRNLLIQGSNGAAASYIEQMKEEGKSLAQIIQQLEMHFGNLRTPEEARVSCNTMVRNPGEDLSTYLDRLRIMARMACRMEPNEAVRRRNNEELVGNNIKRVLPASVSTSLAERVLNRSLNGLPALTVRELEAECLELERARTERRAGEKHAAKAGRIMKCSQEAVVNSLTYSSEEESSDDEVDIDDPVYHLVQEVKAQHKHYARKGEAVDPKKVYRRAFAKFNKEHPPPKFPRGAQHHGARLAAGFGQGNPIGNPNSGPPNKLDVGVKRTITELLAMAGVVKGTCIQCGNTGHYMHNDLCVLKDKVLVDRACAKCGQGLHSADDCPRVYQKQYIAAPGPQANPVQAEGPVKE